MLLGVKPTRVANVQERDAWQRVDAQLEQDERQKWVDDALSALDEGDVEAVRAGILARAQSKGEQPQAIANAIAKRSVEVSHGKDPRQSPGFSERLGLATGAMGTELSETDRLMLMQRVMIFFDGCCVLCSASHTATCPKALFILPRRFVTLSASSPR